MEVRRGLAVCPLACTALAVADLIQSVDAHKGGAPRGAFDIATTSALVTRAFAIDAPPFGWRPWSAPCVIAARFERVEIVGSANGAGRRRAGPQAASGSGAK